MKKTPFGLALAVMVFMTAGIGCRSQAPAVVFYSLSPMAREKPPACPAEALKEAVIEIGPVRLPDFLETPRIAIRSGENRVTLSEFHRWAGNLKEEFQRTVTENLSLLLGSDRVMTHAGLSGVRPDYRVIVAVRRFDGRPGDSLILKGAWTLLGRTGGPPLLVRGFNIRRPVPDSSHDALVAAHGLALEDLSREIAANMIMIAAD
jgi:uncharacterized lipoprotein YmbA